MRRSLRSVAIKQQGFTLLELLITILILSVLVSIVVLTLAVTRSRAQQAACKANLRIIYDAISQYQSMHEGDLPPTLDILVGEKYIKSTFKFTCPSGDFGTATGNYRHYYDSKTGNTSCPRPNHNF